MQGGRLQAQKETELQGEAEQRPSCEPGSCLKRNCLESKSRTSFNDYLKLSKWLATYPLCFSVSGLGLVISAIVAGMITMPMNIETDFESFLKTDVESAVLREVFLAAQESRAEYSRRLQETPSETSDVVFMSKDLFLAYELIGPGGSNGIFNNKAISAIVRFEESLRSLPEWRAICGRATDAHRGLCDPGVSFANYMLPTPEAREVSVVPASLTLDGEGWDVLPIRTALLLAERHQLDKLLLPSNLSSDAEDPLSARVMRSAFRFKLPCCRTGDSLDERRVEIDKFTEEWHRFSTKVLMPVLRRGVYVDGTMVRIWYQGSNFQEFEVKEALAGDFVMAGVSFVFVLLYLLLHTRSPLLAIMGPLIALLSVPLTYVVCALLFGATTVNFANFLALFLIVGFGADVLFVFTDYWRESEFKAEAQDYTGRLAWTFHRAAKASFATVATTAVSFLANLASVLRALRQFGFFMGVCVLLTWVLILFIYTPLCVVDEKLWARCRRGSCSAAQRSLKARFIGCWVACLDRWRRTVCMVSLLLFVLFVATGVPNIKPRENLPSIFPEGHNQNQGHEVFGQFASVAEHFGSKFEPPPERAKVCTVRNFTSHSCDLHWCEAANGPPLLGSTEGAVNKSECRCFRDNDRGPCRDNRTVQVVLRLVGRGTLQSQDKEAIIRFLMSTSQGLSFESGLDNQAAPLVIQEWETGLVAVHRMVQVSVEMRRVEEEANCGWRDYCFCGAPMICSLPDSEEIFTQSLTLPRAEQPDRRLQGQPAFSPTLDVRLRAKVRVIFGLDVSYRVNLLAETDPSESWTYNPSFDLRQPWSQRNLYAFCERFPAHLRLVRSWCWMRDFRSFVTGEGLRFPVRAHAFHQAALDYAEKGLQPTRGLQYLWVAGREVKGLYVSMEIDVSKSASPKVALEHKANWDAYLADYNANAFQNARGAFHVSKLWETAESQSHLISSTIQTMLILVILAFVGMLVITRSFTLSGYVVAATIFVVSGLVFFLTVIMSWRIGLIEVLAIIYFIGYALDYSLHITHKYASSEALDCEPAKSGVVGGGDEPDERLRRTRYALRSIGGAALGSAITTAGASLFLTFCTLTVFRKLGSMCFTVTLVSIVAALCPLPALLLWKGPLNPGKGWPTSCRQLRELPNHTLSFAVRREPRARE